LPIAAFCLLAAAAAPAENVYRDPMRPYEAPAEAGARAEPVRWRLSTVLVSPERRVAVINGRICREGDRVDGALVVAIERRSVRLRVGSKDMILAFTHRASGEAQQQEENAP
jgi:MSHA biogenesis protein MshK